MAVAPTWCWARDPAAAAAAGRPVRAEAALRALQRERRHAVHLRELAALDPAAGGHHLRGGAAGGPAALRVGAAEAGGERGGAPSATHPRP